MQTNNEYYKEICESYGISIDGRTHNNNYYLNKIAENVCGTSYTETTCNGKYLKDIAEELGSTTYSSHHFNNFYLKEICTALNPQSTYDNKSDNYLLQVWKASVVARKKSTSLTINLDKNFLEVGERVTVSGRLTDSDGNPIANAPLISHSNSQTANMTTNANGEYSIKWYYGTSAYNTIAHHYVTYAGNWKYIGSQSETKDVSFRRTSTLLLETPMITYTDEFDVEGSLTDGLGEPISNATVTLTWNDGSDHTATTTTSNTGGILLHRDAVTTAGTYSFQLSFDGGSRYVASNSSVVNVVPDKEEAVMNITSPSSSSTVSSDSVTVSGTLKDNDNTAMSGKSVSFTLNNVSVGTATVENDGTFSKTLTGLVLGSNSISCSIPSTDTHTDASQSITVNRPPFDDFSISADANLSYADGDTTDVTVQLLVNGGSASQSGVSVTIYKDGSVWYTANTDSNGRVSKTYTSEGTGDVVFTAEVSDMSVTKTFTVTDALKYYDSVSQTFNDQNGINSINRYTLPNDSDSYVITGIMKTNGSNVRISLGTVNHITFENPGTFIQVQVNSGVLKCNNTTVRNYTYDTDIDFKIVKEGTTVKFYVDDTLYDTQTNKSGHIYLCTTQWFAVNNTLTVTDLVIKPLQSISVDVDNPILSFADSTQQSPQVATLTATVSPVIQGKTVKIYKDDTLVATEQTDSQGQVSYEYTSQGVGDVEFEFKCGLLTETYTVHDYWKYIASGSQTFSSTGLGFSNLVDLNDLTGDYEATVKLSSTQSKAFGIALHQANNADNTYLARVGFDSNPNAGITVITTSITESYNNTSKHSSANVPYDMSIKRENGVYTLTVDGHSHSLTSPPSNLRYLGLESWNVAKTISYTELKVKPL